jgi:sigma-B regulation protein RsbU (phosphoserine phosphatase)
MFYGMYDTDTHEFVYGSAGHEPGFYYSAKEDRFHDMNTKGLVLGIDQSIKYKQYSRVVEKGDMIVLLSDGVTESKTNEEEFIEREFITDLIKKYSDLNAQGIVDNIYKDFLQMQDFELRDDFTLIILKREV